MKKTLLLLWLIVPLVFAAYHFGPGQRKVKLDEAQKLIDLGYSSVDKEDYSAGVDYFSKALALLTDKENKTSRRIRLELAKARMFNGQLPKARDEMQTLINDLTIDKQANPALLRDAKSAFANTRYYMTYLMKLEGLPQQYWEPEIEAARQEYKHLAQQSANDPHLQKAFKEDLEATIRLARADIDDLQGRAIPKP